MFAVEASCRWRQATAGRQVRQPLLNAEQPATSGRPSWASLDIVRALGVVSVSCSQTSPHSCIGDKAIDMTRAVPWPGAAKSLWPSDPGSKYPRAAAGVAIGGWVGGCAGPLAADLRNVLPLVTRITARVGEIEGPVHHLSKGRRDSGGPGGGGLRRLPQSLRLSQGGTAGLGVAPSGLVRLPHMGTAHLPLACLCT